MYKLFFFLSVVIFFSNCHTTKVNSVNTSILTRQEKNEGWQSLFDGQTMKGWHGYGKKVVPKAWKAENGVIHLDAASKKNYATEEGGDIVTDEEFDNFDLKMEWKISQNGNSGIIFYVKEAYAQDTLTYKNSYYTGPEMQVVDNIGHKDGKIYKHKAGDLYDLLASTKESPKLFGEWNQAEIIANQGKLDLYLNGEHVVGTTMWDDNWRQMIAGSKFKQWRDFGTFKKGRIDLQDHGDEVWYRNIKIKRL